MRIALHIVLVTFILLAAFTASIFCANYRAETQRMIQEQAMQRISSMIDAKMAEHKCGCEKADEQ